MISAIIKRDLLLAWRSGGSWLHSLLFFALFITLSAIALGGNLGVLSPLAPALIWLAVILALLLSFERIFQADADDGSLEQLRLSGSPMISVTLGKLIAHWLLICLPLLIATPLAALSLGLRGPEIAVLFNSLLVGSPALIVYGAFASACMIGYRQAGLLIILLTVPFILPTLIFALSSVDSYADEGMLNAAFKALCGISLIAIGLGTPAISAAISAKME